MKKAEKIFSFSSKSKKGLIKFLLKNKGRLKKLLKFEGFYLTSLWGLYSCKSDDDAASAADGPVFNSNTPIVTINEGVKSVGKVLSTSTDGSVVYSLGTERDNDLFIIDRGTGILSFKRNSDYEIPKDTGGDNNYEVLITVSEGDKDFVRAVIIKVNDINNKAPEITNISYMADEGASAVQLMARDADGSSVYNSLTFSMLDTGFDNDKFSISADGELTFKTIPNYESPIDANNDNVFEVLITVSDGTAGTNDVSTTVMITVKDLNDNTPEITSTSYTVEEGISAVQLMASDADGTSANNSLTYSISETGNDNDLFSMDISTGILNFKVVPDYEMASDADGDNVYEVLVTVSDGVEGTEDVSAIIMVRVEAVNDNAPEITSTSYMADEGISTVQIMAIDNDANVEHNSLSFSISTTGNDNGEFRISADGELTFTSVPDYEMARDADGDNIYEVLVTVSDGVDGTADLIETIMVTVEDVNDNTPRITSTSYTVGEGNSTVQILATDDDGTADYNSLTFSIGTGGVDDSLFSISADGELTFATVTNYDSPADADGDNIYEVLVTVSDGVAGTNDISETVMVTVEAINAIDEGMTFVGRVLEYDGIGATYSLPNTGRDNAFFSIDGSTGELSFKVAPDYENPLDTFAEDGAMAGDNIYELLVTASDGVNPVSEVVKVTVNDANDNEPQFTETSYMLDEGTSTVQIMAIDNDGTVAHNSLSFSIATTGNDNAFFSIDGSTGILSFNNEPDYENAEDADGDNIYSILVTVTDGVTAVSVVATIEVNNVNDNATEFDSSTLMHTAAEGVRAVGQVLATDADGTVVYSISTTGIDNGFLNIDRSTGELSFKTAPDYESPLDYDNNNIYEVLVTANDDGGVEVARTVRVTVNDANDNEPEFTETNYSVDEGTSTVQIMAIDEDGTVAYNSLTYSISTTGNDNGEFSISTDGLLTFTTTPDYEMPTDAGANNVYEVLVTVSDGVSPVIETVLITVTDVNDNVPVFDTRTLIHTVSEGEAVVGSVSATDADGITIAYSLVVVLGRSDNDLFNIDRSTGELSFRVAPDFENPLDVGSDNIYEVLVVASNGGINPATTVVMVTVEDVDGELIEITGPVIFNPVRGGSGGNFDTLVFNGEGIELDLRNVPDDMLRDIEIVDLTGTGDNRLRINAEELQALGGFADRSAGKTRLLVRGDFGDAVHVDLGIMGSTIYERENYFTFDFAGSDYQLLIDTDIREIHIRHFDLNLDLDTNRLGFKIDGEEDGDWSGGSVSNAGDINGDGYDDFIIGASGASSGEGAGYVIFGSPIHNNISLWDTSFTGFRIIGEEVNTGLSSISSDITVSGAGDINSDGYDDLIVGFEHVSVSKGASYVIFGKETSFIDIDLGDPSSWSSNVGFKITGEDDLDRSGVVSNAGDINGDGYDDFIIGAYLAEESSNPGDNNGISYVIYGRETAGFRDIFLGNASSFTNDIGFKIIGESPLAYSGASVSSAGDVNSDGYDDLLIGALGEEGEKGVSYVIYGRATPFSNIDLGNASSFTNDIGFKITGEDDGELFGTVSSAGDINGDGYNDLIIGAYLAEQSTDPDTARGASYVIYGRATPFSDIDLGSTSSFTSDIGFKIVGEDDGDWSGGSVSSAGDVNGDGYDDLLIGAERADNRKGVSYVIFGRATPFSDILLSEHFDPDTTGFKLVGEDAGDRSGISVSSAGDVNGDGYDDLVIGALLAEQDSSDQGRSYVLFGRAFVPGSVISGLGIINGTNGAENLVGSNRDDFIDTMGGADSVRAGAGDDRIGVGTDFFRIDGGRGFDSLVLTGSGLSLDLTSLGNTLIKDIEQISLTGTGNNSLTINALNLNALGGLRESGKTKLIIEGNAGDSLITDDTWVANGTEGYAGSTYNLYEQGAYQLLVGRVNTSRAMFNEEIAITNGNITTAIDGGAGFDTLSLDGTAISLDLTTVADNLLTNIEKIDLTGTGANILTLDVSDMMALGGFMDGGNTILVIDGDDANDRVVATGGWTLATASVIMYEGENYASYGIGTDLLYISQDIVTGTGGIDIT